MIALVLAAALVSPRAEIYDEDRPRRIAVERLDLSGDHIEIGSCATRLLGRSAKVQNYPIRDGVGLEWTIKSGLFMSAPGDPLIAMEFLSDAKGAYLKALYRHPLSAKAARQVVAKAAKTCFPDDWKRWSTVQ